MKLKSKFSLSAAAGIGGLLAVAALIVGISAASGQASPAGRPPVAGPRVIAKVSGMADFVASHALDAQALSTRNSISDVEYANAIQLTIDCLKAGNVEVTVEPTDQMGVAHYRVHFLSPPSHEESNEIHDAIGECRRSFEAPARKLHKDEERLVDPADTAKINACLHQRGVQATLKVPRDALALDEAAMAVLKGCAER